MPGGGICSGWEWGGVGLIFGQCYVNEGCDLSVMCWRATFCMQIKGRDILMEGVV